MLARHVPLYRHIADLAGIQRPVLPLPMVNIISGGLHAGGQIDLIRERLYTAVLADILDQLGHRQSCMSARVCPLSPCSVVVGRARTALATEVYALPDKPYEGEIERFDGLPRYQVRVYTNQRSTRAACWRRDRYGPQPPCWCEPQPGDDRASAVARARGWSARMTPIVPPSFDVLLRGGWIADGSGAPPFRADLGVSGDRIAEIGRLDGASAATELDAAGLYLLPGFIDAHVHGDARVLDRDTQLAALRQGVTTYVLGQDGLSFAPASAGTIDFVSRYFAAVNGACPSGLRGGCSVADLLGMFDGRTALNVAYLAPHGTIRADVMGLENRPPSALELAAMRQAVEQALDEGAIGLSTGLDYVPGRFADAAELTALCQPVAQASGVYVTHMRGYEAEAWRGMAEVSAIAEGSGVAAHVSHYHGPANMLASLVDEGRARGLDITFDTYPYLRGSTILAMVALPAEVQEGGVQRSLERLTTSQVRNRLLEEWFPAMRDVLPRVVLSYIAAPRYSWAEGTPLPEAAQRAGMPIGEFVCDLLVASELAVGCVFAQPPTNTEADVRALLRHPAHLASSDGILLGSRPHPRAWGAFARFLGRHTRELGDWHWGEAALHLAGHTARRFGLADRGLLRRGMAADLVVLDPVAIADRATYEEPRRLADGVAYVLVNGVAALRAGELTDAIPGRALRGQGARR